MEDLFIQDFDFFHYHRRCFVDLFELLRSGTAFPENNANYLAGNEGIYAEGRDRTVMLSTFPVNVVCKRVENEWIFGKIR